MKVSTSMVRLAAERDQWRIKTFWGELVSRYGVDQFDPFVRSELHRLRESGVLEVTLSHVKLAR